MGWRERISMNPGVIFGKPAITGIREAVGFIFLLLQNGWRDEDVLHNYLHITPEDGAVVRACVAELAFAHTRWPEPDEDDPF